MREESPYRMANPDSVKFDAAERINALSGIRVELAIHRMELGSNERPKDENAAPTRVTMAREIPVASRMLRPN
jgi:hypothetical protein